MRSAAFCRAWPARFRRAEAQRVIGLSLVEAMAELAPTKHADLHGRMAPTYRDAFVTLRGAREVEEPLYDGIPPLLDALEDAAGCWPSPPASPIAACATA